jgi:predicted negative regulator of RcsB-dependent stress response
MTVLANEQEQLEAIKSWWKNYGKLSVIVFLIGISASYGWKMWQRSQSAFNEQASLIYDQMLSSFNQHNQDALIARANTLSNDFSKTAYASMANFMLGHLAVEQGNFDKALKEFKQVMQSSSDAKIRQIARVRAARILLAKHQLKEALAMLEVIDNPTFLPQINEVKGDVFVAMGDAEKARDSYKAALGATEKGEFNRPLLEMKFEQLSVHTNALASATAMSGVANELPA